MAYQNSATKPLTAQLRLKGGVAVRTLTGAVTADATTENVGAWDPGGAHRDVTLPPEESSEGLVVWFKNTADAAENLVIKDDAGSTIVTIGQGEFALVACTGSAWTSMKSSVAAYGDNTALNLGDGNDIVLTWDGTRLNVTQATPNSEIRWGVDGAGIDQRLYGDTASQSWLWDQSADAVVMTSAVSITGQGSTVVPVIPIAAQQALSGAGAVNITSYYTAWTTTGANAGTLANGAQKGQLKKIQLIVDGGDGTLTPTSLSGGTTITFADAGDFAVLCWNGTAWVAIELGNDADGATAPVLA